MRIKCPACLHNLDFPDENGDGPFNCPDCSARFDRNGARLDQQDMRPVPVVSPVRSRALSPYMLDPGEYEEVVQERRERRVERHEDRDFRRTQREIIREEMLDERDDRRESKDKNGMAIGAFAISLCTGLLLSGGLIFGERLPFYLGVALFFGVPGAILGLILSVVALLSRKAMRPLAIAALSLSGVQLLVLIPLGMLILKHKF